VAFYEVAPALVAEVSNLLLSAKIKQQQKSANIHRITGNIRSNSTVTSSNRKHSNSYTVALM